MQFVIQQHLLGLGYNIFAKQSGPDSCYLHKDNFFVLVFVQKQFPHLIIIPMRIIFENLKQF